MSTEHDGDNAGMREAMADLAGLQVAINTARTLAKQLRKATEFGDLKAHALNAATVLEYLANAATDGASSEPPRLFRGTGAARVWTPSDDVIKTMDDLEWSGIPSRHDANGVDLFNCDGDRVACGVQANIETRTLRALRYETREAFDRGERQGRAYIRGKLRDLIGAAAQGDVE